jgi:hypothetical protein
MRQAWEAGKGRSRKTSKEFVAIITASVLAWIKGVVIKLLRW